MTHDSNKSPEQLFDQVYSELRQIAAARLRSERAGHTLQPTALVHEVWVRMSTAEQPGWSSRGQFFAAAVQAMRRVLIDHARARAAVRRGGDSQGRPARRAPLDSVQLACSGNLSGILAVDEAIARLKQQDAELARLVELRFFAGLDAAESAEVLGVSERTVRRDWTLAKAWLRRELAEEDGE